MTPMRMLLVGGLVVFAAAFAAPRAVAQTPPAGTQTAAPAAPAPAQAAQPSPLEPRGYTYEPEGRRDPFVSLVRRGDDSSLPAFGARPPGLQGMATSEVALTGVYKGRDGVWVAMLRGVDRKSYLAKPGDKLLDGEVRTVTENSMVILQRVNDPLSLATQREVRKELRKEEAN